ncbi:MAG: zinc ribbon domain-containing protein, partial [Anaerolineales bacterium]|nr:zinc ribbon domain-containing protein [Anaerolineales bacterium]
QPAQEKLITDDQKLARAQAAPDIHCPFCGARNPAGQTTCIRCGGDLTEGEQRGAGQVVGAHRRQAAPDVACPACGTLNPATAVRCTQCATPLPKPEAAPRPTPAPRAAAGRGGSRIWLFAIAGFLLVACIAIVFLSSRTTETVGVVEAVNWERTIALEALVPVEREDWLDEIPASAPVGACEQRVRRTQDSPAPGAREVCGTPYTVDEGTGFGQVVQDCVYEISDDWCEYTVDEWREVDTLTATGADFLPAWPEQTLLAEQRLGDQEESYRCVFNADGATYTYTTSRLEEFKQCEIGSEWILNVNTFNNVRSIEPRE